jgi:glucose dehydrogenase
LDSFPAELSFCLHLLIGSDAVVVGHGGWLSAMFEKDQKLVRVTNFLTNDMGPQVVLEGDPASNTGLLYVGVLNICVGLTDHEVSYIAGTPYDGMKVQRLSVDGKDGNWGGLLAWNPAHGKKIWEIPGKFMVMRGVFSTASDLIFYGTTDGWFRAVDAWTGKVL